MKINDLKKAFFFISIFFVAQPDLTCGSSIPLTENDCLLPKYGRDQHYSTKNTCILSQNFIEGVEAIYWVFQDYDGLSAEKQFDLRYQMYRSFVFLTNDLDAIKRTKRMSDIPKSTYAKFDNIRNYYDPSEET